MAADNWTITDGDRDTVTLTILISDVNHSLLVSIEELKPIASAQDALTKVRARAVAFRTAVLDSLTRPTMVASAIGHNELF